MSSESKQNCETSIKECFICQKCKSILDTRKKTEIIDDLGVASGLPNNIVKLVLDTQAWYWDVANFLKER